MTRDGKDPDPVESSVPAGRFRLLAPLRWLDNLFFMLELAAHILWRRSEIDVLHVHESMSLAGWVAWIGSRAGIPVCCKESTWPGLRPLEPDVPFARSLDRWRRAPLYIAMTRDIARSLADAGIPPTRIRTIRNGVAVPPESAAVEVNQGVLYVGNLDQGAQAKAFDVLIRAWGRVARSCPSARLTIVGRGDQTAWAELAKTEGCLATVDFAGAVTDVSPFYRDASLLVLPSRREGMSNALLEAQSWGLPAVVSDIPGNRVVVEDGVSGIIVPVGDSDALAAAILRLLQDAATRRQMGAAARARMISDFGMDKIAEKLITLYRDLVAAPEVLKARAAGVPPSGQNGF